jgi:hypothetical protein
MPGGTVAWFSKLARADMRAGMVVANGYYWPIATNNALEPNVGFRRAADIVRSANADCRLVRPQRGVMRAAMQGRISRRKVEVCRVLCSAARTQRMSGCGCGLNRSMQHFPLEGKDRL